MCHHNAVEKKTAASRCARHQAVRPVQPRSSRGTERSGFRIARVGRVFGIILDFWIEFSGHSALVEEQVLNAFSLRWLPEDETFLS